MLARLELKPGERVLEPCAGDGVFIEALLEAIPGLRIEAREIRQTAYNTLRQKFATNTSVNIQHVDTLLHDEPERYDKIIANPPYGAWQDPEKRKLLKRLYPGLYVKETYGLFLYKCIRLLKEGGRLCFIIPDTYLHLHMHTALRRTLLGETAIDEIIKFPADFFPGINFGYAGLSIISLRKTATPASDAPPQARGFQVRYGFRAPEEFLTQDPKATNHIQVRRFRQDQVHAAPEHALYIFEDPKVGEIFRRSEKRLGELADIVTGIYTGDDKKYLATEREKSSGQKSAGSYKTISSEKIDAGFGGAKRLLGGLNNSAAYIPLHKSRGRQAYINRPDWYIKWTPKALAHYKRDKKARFQNSAYYFQEGLGLPMVKTKTTRAFLLEGRLFDQSIVGIFPREKTDMYFLLGLLNSKLFSKLMEVINPSANNSANYVKKVPVPDYPPQTRQAIETTVQAIIQARRLNQTCAELSETLDSLFMD